MIRRILPLVVILACVTALQIGCGSDDGDNGNGPGPVAPPRVLVEAHQDPTFANALDSPVWDSIEVEEIPIGTENEYNSNLLYVSNRTVDMKALIADDSLLYIRVQWDDADEDNRFGQLRASWINNRITWAVHYPEDTSNAAFNEDRFYMVFDQGGPNGADCAGFCHGIGSESATGHRFYGAAGDDADVWHWKAHRTGLAKLADDMHMTTTQVDRDPQDMIGDDLYFLNYDNPLWPDSANNPGYMLVQPIKMHEDGIAYTGAGLLESEITDPSGIFTPFNSGLDWVRFFPDQPPAGRSLPGFTIWDESGHDGSRWDVGAISEHNGSTWTVVFRRALTTGDADDVGFSFSSLDSIEVSIGITDNSGVDHFGRRPFYLVFP
jgi:hypothetical protein